MARRHFSAPPAVGVLRRELLAARRRQARLNGAASYDTDTVTAGAPGHVRHAASENGAVSAASGHVEHAGNEGSVAAGTSGHVGHAADGNGVGVGTNDSAITRGVHSPDLAADAVQPTRIPVKTDTGTHSLGNNRKSVDASAVNKRASTDASAVNNGASTNAASVNTATSTEIASVNTAASAETANVSKSASAETPAVNKGALRDDALERPQQDTSALRSEQLQPEPTVTKRVARAEAVQPTETVDLYVRLQVDHVTYRHCVSPLPHLDTQKLDEAHASLAFSSTSVYLSSTPIRLSDDQHSYFL